MATKIICDKCKKEIQKNVYRCVIGRSDIENTQPFDLCEECYKALMQFIQAPSYSSSVSGLTWDMR